VTLSVCLLNCCSVGLTLKAARRQDRVHASRESGRSVEVEHSYARLVPGGYSLQPAHPVAGVRLLPCSVSWDSGRGSASLSFGGTCRRIQTAIL
jgi:hypothetical protein